ncbi:tRNA (adenosine(37)-N6)-threonylcarbamoyltransferase complex ATPase subunit type 1 TsaE [Albibacterium bauzanense]|uniref:tRNA (adenosine(37)-N6)-threonylcarbamoyltransferase complex ATPase subunit type 1 TsaE n=1 Tax=Albibacterium bauzanense TaxID=653929 RepID=UPI001FEA9D14|nr:tRNA (adenosine(37)-N6)-threonylcarbamoyltransferase complex ATPase subunit type 1 TsaE [Albibacterium bauzanense]
MKEIILNQLNQLPQVATQLLELAGEKKVFLFEAPMGAGKTTIIKALCKELGVEDPITSPTFSIVNEYIGKDGPIYHFDFYRLKDEQEAYDLGYEEYFYSGNYCFVEWPQKINSLLPDDAFLIQIEVVDQTRLLKIDA